MSSVLRISISHASAVLFVVEAGNALHLLSTVNETLLNGRNALLLFDLFLDLRNLSRIILSGSFVPFVGGGAAFEATELLLHGTSQ